VSAAAAVLFDLDGVLVDSRAAIGNSMHAALVARGHAAPPVEQLHRYIGPPLLWAYSQIVGEPIDAPEVVALAAAYRERYRVASLTETLVVPGIVDVLERLGATHALAVATSKPRPYSEPLLAALDLRRHFAFVGAPALDDELQSKATTVCSALDALGCERAVMVGDRSYDVEGAHANAIPAIAVGWGIGDAHELREAEAHVGAPAELPAAIERLLG